MSRPIVPTLCAKCGSRDIHTDLAETTAYCRDCGASVIMERADPGVSEGRAQPALTHTEKMALDAWLFDPEYPGFNLVAVAAIVKKIAYPPSGLSLGEPAREELAAVIWEVMNTSSPMTGTVAMRCADAVLSWFAARQQQQLTQKEEA